MRCKITIFKSTEQAHLADDCEPLNNSSLHKSQLSIIVGHSSISMASSLPIYPFSTFNREMGFNHFRKWEWIDARTKVNHENGRFVSSTEIQIFSVSKSVT